MALTDREKQLIRDAWNSGRLNEDNWALFLEDVRNEPDPENAVENALKMDLGSRFRRSFEKRRDILADPGRMGRLAKEFKEEHGGYLGAGAEILKQTVMSTPRIVADAGSLATGGGFGRDPLEKIISAAQIVPYTRMGLGFAGAGLKAAGKVGAAKQVGRAASTPGLVWSSRGAEVADVVGSENPIIEAIGEGSFEVAATGASRIAQSGPVRTRRQRRVMEQLLGEERAAAGVTEVNPDTGDEVTRKRDRVRDRKRRSYTFGDGGRADIERRGTRQWTVNIQLGTETANFNIDNVEGVNGFESAFNRAMRLFAEQYIPEGTDVEGEAAAQGETVTEESDAGTGEPAAAAEAPRIRAETETVTETDQQEVDLPAIARDFVDQVSQENDLADMQAQRYEGLEAELNRFLSDITLTPEQRGEVGNLVSAEIATRLEEQTDVETATETEETTTTTEVETDATETDLAGTGETSEPDGGRDGEGTESVEEVDATGDDGDAPPPEIEMPNDLTGLLADEQMARLAHSRDVLMEWVNENQDGEPSPEVVEMLDDINQRMDVLERVLTEEQQRIEEAEERDVEDTQTESDTTDRAEVGSPAREETIDTTVDGEGGSDADARETGVDADEITEEGDETALVVEDADRPDAIEAGDSGDVVSPNAPTPEGRFAYALLEKFQRGEPVTDFREFYRLADEAWGDTRENGAYTEKQAYNVAEAAANHFLTTQGIRLSALNVDLEQAQRNIEGIQALEALLPRQSVRDRTTQDTQQFSTPFSYGYAVNWIANVQAGDVVLEPSAGTGNLAIYGLSNGAEVYVNELDPHRLETLRLLGFTGVFNHDAMQIDNLLAENINPTVVVMNPPFSRDQGRRDLNTGGDHIIQALRRLRDGGRLVAIVGGGINRRGQEGLRGMATTSPTYARFFEQVREMGQLRANIHVDGSVYSRFGTDFDTRVLVIDKLQSTAPATVEGSVQNLNELVQQLQEIRNERPEPEGNRTDEPDTTVEPSGAQPPRVTATPGETGGRTRTAGDDAGEVGDRQPSDVGQPVETDAGRTDSDSEDVDTETTDELLSEGDGGQRAVRSAGQLERERIARTSGDGGRGASTVESKERTDGGARGTGQRRRLTQDEAANTFRRWETSAETMPANAKPHPGKLDETGAMADVPSPEATYVPNLPPESIESGAISQSQLESIILTGQAQETHISAVFTPEELHDMDITEADAPRQVRAGFFNGDSTGVGKGRTAAGVILDNYRRGRKKALWLSAGADLYNDAQRDIRGIGDDPKRSFNLSKSFKIADTINLSEGTLFTTYATLQKSNAAGRSRIDQIVEWLGEDFDGAIIFDEVHHMNNAMTYTDAQGKHEASKSAIAGLKLETKLPNARVLYMSATGATEVRHITFANRLGLWGPGTAFETKRQFVDQIVQGGIAAMEVVARDLKARGKYIRRQLSFEDVEYEELVHDYDSEQIRVHDRFAELWRRVFRSMDQIIENLNMPPAYGKSQFYGRQQAFFNQLFVIQKMPTVLRKIEEQVNAGNAVTIQITSTGQAALERVLANAAIEHAIAQGEGTPEERARMEARTLNEEEWQEWMQEGMRGARQGELDLESLEVTPKDILIRFLEQTFPIIAHRIVTDENGNEVSEPIMRNGRPLVDRQALEARNRFIAEVNALPLGGAPLDQIINRFGIGQVAEVTRRNQRLVFDRAGNRVLQRRPGSNQGEIDDFMDDKKQILVFSKAGGTGASYHADNERTNRRPRYHIVLDVGWSAKDAIQGLGRTHRSNQAQAPKIALARSNNEGERRFWSTISRRLDQVGALTSGDRGAASGGVMRAEDNLETTYARTALQNMITMIHTGELEIPVPLPDGREMNLDLQTLEEFLDLGMRDDQGNFSATEVPEITQFLNRVLALPFSWIDIVLNNFIHQLQMVLDYHRQQGTLDVGTETINTLGAELLSSQTIYTDATSGAESTLETVETTVPMRKNDLDSVMGEQGFRRFVEGAQGGIYAEFSAPNRTARDGTQTPQVRWVSPNTRRFVEMQAAQRSGVPLGTVANQTIMDRWQQEYDQTPDTRKQNLYMLTGAILPIWDRMPEDATVKVRRVFLDDGEALLGRIIEEGDIAELSNNLGIVVDQTTGDVQQQREWTVEETQQALREEGKTLSLANGWELRMTNRMGADWIQVVGPIDTDMPLMDQLNIEVRAVGGQTLFLIPVGNQGVPILQALIRRHRVTGEAQRGPNRAVLRPPPQNTPQGTPETPPDTSTPPETPPATPTTAEGATRQIADDHTVTNVGERIIVHNIRSPGQTQPTASDFSREAARLEAVNRREVIRNQRGEDVSADEMERLTSLVQNEMARIKAIPIEQRRHMSDRANWQRQGNSAEFVYTSEANQARGTITVHVDEGDTAIISMTDLPRQRIQITATGRNHTQRFENALEELRRILNTPERLEQQQAGIEEMQQQERAAEQTDSSALATEETPSPAPQPDVEVSDEVAQRFWQMSLSTSRNPFVPRQFGEYGDSREQEIARAKEILQGLKAIPLDRRRNMVLPSNWTRTSSRGGVWVLNLDGQQVGYIEVRKGQAEIRLDEPAVPNIDIRVSGSNHANRFDNALGQLQSYLFMPEALEQRLSGSGQVTAETTTEAPAETIPEAQQLIDETGNHPAVNALVTEDETFLQDLPEAYDIVNDINVAAYVHQRGTPNVEITPEQRAILGIMNELFDPAWARRDFDYQSLSDADKREFDQAKAAFLRFAENYERGVRGEVQFEEVEPVVEPPPEPEPIERGLRGGVTQAGQLFFVEDPTKLEMIENAYRETRAYRGSRIDEETGVLRDVRAASPIQDLATDFVNRIESRIRKNDLPDEGELLQDLQAFVKEETGNDYHHLDLADQKALKRAINKEAQKRDLNKKVKQARTEKPMGLSVRLRKPVVVPPENRRNQPQPLRDAAQARRDAGDTTDALLADNVDDLRNDDGSPITLYHGTPSLDKLEESGYFDASLAGSRTETKLESEFYFTDNVEDAETYAVDDTSGDNPNQWEIGPGGGVIAVHLIMRDPLIVSSEAFHSDDSKRVGEFVEDAKAAGHDGVIFKGIINPYVSNLTRDSFESDEEFEEAESRYYSYTANQYVVFDPAQIINAYSGNQMAPDSDGVLQDVLTPRNWELDVEDQREAGVRQLRPRTQPVEVVPFTPETPTPRERPQVRETKSGTRIDGEIGVPQNKTQRREARIFDQQVHGLINEETDPRVKSKLVGLYANIKAGVTVPIQGHKIDSPVEAALIGQVYRNPIVENTWVFYLDENDAVIDYKGWTINRTDATTAGPISAIESDMERLNAASIIRLHNHPSATAAFSDADKQQTTLWRRRLGDKFKGDVIINSGTYAFSRYAEGSTEPEYQDEVQLPAERVGWETGAEAAETGIKPDDPLYKDAQPAQIRAFQETLPWGRGLTDEWSNLSYDQSWEREGERYAAYKGNLAVARVGRLIKSPEDTVTILYVSGNGQIVSAREYWNLHTLPWEEIQDYINEEGEKWGGQAAHVLINKGTWYNTREEAAEKFKGLITKSQREYLERTKGTVYGARKGDLSFHLDYPHYAHGIESVWIDGRPMLRKVPGQGPQIHLSFGNWGAFRRNKPYVQQIYPPLAEGETQEIADDELMSGLLSDVNQTRREVGPEAAVVIPKKVWDSEGGGSRGSGKGADKLSRTLLARWAGLAKYAEAYTPELKARLREAKSELFSGFAALERLGAPGKELSDVLRMRVQAANVVSNRSKTMFDPLTKDFDKWSRERHKALPKDNEESLVNLQARYEEQIWQFIEENKAIDDDPALQQKAQEWKDMWREMLKMNTHFMVNLQTDLESKGFSLDIIDSAQNRKSWRPISAEFGWSPSQKKFTRGRGRNIRYIEIDEAYDQMTQLWTPRIYTKQRLERQIAQADETRALLDALDPNDTNIPGFQYQAHLNTWYWQAGNKRVEFTERDKAIAFAKRQATLSKRVAQQMRQALLTGESREGHLERERETEDRFYVRRLSLLYDVQMRVADRFGELVVFGQFDPEKGNYGGSPFLQEYMKRIREYSADAQEHALREFTKPLLSYDMFEDLEGFDATEPRTAFNALRRWEGKGGIDPNRVFDENEAITEEMKATLVRIGLLRLNQDGTYEMRSQTATARLFGEYFAELALRENTAYKIINGLAAKQTVDPVEVQGQKFWKAINDVTTIGLLGPTATLQNIVELPVISLLTGSKAMLKGFSQFINDKDVRDSGKWLGVAMGTTREYLAEGGQHTFRWLDIIGFNKMDWLGRNVGALAGVERGKKDMRAYVEERSTINRRRLVDLKMDPAQLDAFIEDGGNVARLDKIFEEFNQRYKQGLVPVVGIRLGRGAAAADEFTDILGDELSRAGTFVADDSFKQYNPLSLNSPLARRDPLIRVFLKFQAWGFQQSGHIYRNVKRAFQRALQGDFRATMWLATMMGSLTGAYVGLRWVYDILQGREDKELQDRMIQGFAESMAAGYLSLIIEMIHRAEGSAYDLENSLRYQFTPAILGWLSKPAAALATEGLSEGLKEGTKQLPGVREIRRFGGRALPDEWK